MVPALTKAGRSFKGAAAYYLHDKREEGEAERLTSERVAWTQTVNLPTDDPDRAWRMMATTALAGDQLKAAAGIKATGRKMTTPVLAYSLSWHPDEKPDQAEQLEAARSSLKALGLDEHQALIVCHNDEPHPHVHVVVNKVHPAVGKAATLSNSKLALSKWAQAYEQERGTVYCKKRVENNARRRKGEAVQEPRVPRNIHEAGTRAGNDSLTAAFVKSDQAGKDAALEARGRAMHEAHRQQWQRLKETYRENRSRVFAFAGTRRGQVTDAVKEAFRPQWAELFRRQRRELNEFSFREFTVLGRLQNIADSIRAAGWQDGTARQILGAVFNIAAGARIQAFRQGQEKERHALARVAKASTAGAVAAVRKETTSDLDRLREAYLTRGDTLRTAQAEERDALRQAWADRNTERREAFAALGGREASKWDAIEQAADQAQQTGQGRGEGIELSIRRDFTPG